MTETIGYELKYRSLRGLAEEQQRIAEGRVYVPWGDSPPKIGSYTVIRVVVPGGGAYALPGQVEVCGAQGFVVVLDGSASGGQSALGLMVNSPPFQAALKMEPKDARVATEVAVFHAETPAARSRGIVAKKPVKRPATPGHPGAPKAPAITEDRYADDDDDDDDDDQDDEVSDEVSADSEISEVSATPSPVPVPRPVVRAVPSPVVLPKPVAQPVPLDDTALVEVASGEDTEDPSDRTEFVDRYDDYDDGVGDDDEEEGGTVISDDDDEQPSTFQTPGPGDAYVVFVMKFATLKDFLVLVDTFTAHAKIAVPYKQDPGKPGDLAQLRLIFPGRNTFVMYAIYDAVTPQNVTLRVNKESAAFQNASVFHLTLLGKRRLDSEREEMRKPVECIRFEEKRATEDFDKLPLRRRISRMSMDDKINMALSGNREERMALAVDGNKAIHHYLLKNARISLDEVAFIARLPTMNPDVLAKIGENPAYLQNQTVLKNLIYNPKTPVPLAIRLLDRLPRPELMNLAKRTSMNLRVVMAAKKRLEGRSK